jgi:hypothetical protein
MRHLLILILVSFLYNPLSSSTDALLLEKVMKPHALLITKKHIVVAGEKTVQLYSLKDGSFIRFFGRLGMGPGEFSSRPQIYFQPPDTLLINSRMKLTIFNLDGTHIKDVKFPQMISKIIPLDSKYMASLFNIVGEKRAYSHSAALCDSRFQLIKKLDEHITPNPIRRIDVIFFKWDFKVYQNKVFIIKPQNNGLLINVFDHNGNSVYSINKEFEKIKVPREFVQKKREEIKKAKKEYWPLLKDTLYFPAFFPVVQNFFINDHKIYIKTWLSRDDLIQFIVMDLRGMEQKAVYMPDTGKLFAIDTGRYFYLKENIEKEIWELHQAALK